ncbi:MAG TPA: hypothetical protein VMZ69_04235 [Saprospiraceae bacterium]|nr:hypothetical protein [Saprospiraceae bacterium]
MNYYTSLYLVVAMGFLGPLWDISVPLCGTMIGLSVHGDEHSSVLLYNMHDNENTSALAGRIISSNYGGQYYELVHSGDRNIGFANGEDSIWIDPNRIYTDTGIWLQLEKNNCTDTILFEYIAQWRDTLLTVLKISERSLVIALHNNTNQFYSLASYMEGGEYSIDADTTYMGQIRDLDDFYFVTDPVIYETLSTGRYHVVLQANATVTDDGSLSVYCGKLGIPYINVEAQHRHLVRQVKMLIFAFSRLVNSRI